MIGKTNEVVLKAIDDLEQKYKENANLFFNEHDFHHWFFCMVCDKLKNLIHPEYPTRKRFRRKKAADEDYKTGKHSFPPEKIRAGRRGHYDFIVLNDEFYNKFVNNFDRLSSKDKITNLDLKHKYIDIAIEFKYITQSINIGEIEYDLFKLTEAEEVQKKIFVIFLRKDIRNFEQFYSKLITSTSSEKAKNINIKIIQN